MLERETVSRMNAEKQLSDVKVIHLLHNTNVIVIHPLDDVNYMYLLDNYLMV